MAAHSTPDPHSPLPQRLLKKPKSNFTCKWGIKTFFVKLMTTTQIKKALEEKEDENEALMNENRQLRKLLVIKENQLRAAEETRRICEAFLQAPNGLKNSSISQFKQLILCKSLESGTRFPGKEATFRSKEEFENPFTVENVEEHLMKLQEQAFEQMVQIKKSGGGKKKEDERKR